MAAFELKTGPRCRDSDATTLTQREVRNASRRWRGGLDDALRRHLHKIEVRKRLEITPRRTIAGRTSSLNETSFRNFSATAKRASPGQAVNQSMAQQLTSEGNNLNLSRKAEPIGENANMMCRYCFTL